MQVSKRILVIDDEDAIRKSFVLALEDTGFQVDTAESGMRGIDLERVNHYDLIFLDLKMPVMNGIETLRELRKIDKEVPVYIVTAFYAEFFDGLNEAGRDGIDFEIVKKPVDGANLREIAKANLEGLSAG
jgi:DNA-binding response OmpR family regulator